MVLILIACQGTSSRFVLFSLSPKGFSWAEKTTTRTYAKQNVWNGRGGQLNTCEGDEVANTTSQMTNCEFKNILLNASSKQHKPFQIWLPHHLTIESLSTILWYACQIPVMSSITAPIDNRHAGTKQVSIPLWNIHIQVKVRWFHNPPSPSP